METVLEFEKPIFELKRKLDEMRDLAGENQVELDGAIQELEQQLGHLKQKIYQDLSPWQRVQLARHPARPYTNDYIQAICTEYIELFGDRVSGDDKAIVGGLGRIDGYSVMIIGHQKGRDTKRRQYRNFGMANPAGYRKALRLMQMAEQFGIPVVTLIDTPGAFPGIEAEERGQGEAIARNLREMAVLRVPILAFIIGEGASGGALGIGVANRVYMLENTWYSVISPESCSSILWRSWDHKEEAAVELHLTAQDNLKLGLIDGIIPEPLGGAHQDPSAAYSNVKRQIVADLQMLLSLSTEELVSQRIEKFARMGPVEIQPA